MTMNISFQNPHLLVLLLVLVPVIYFIHKGYQVRQRSLHDFTGEPVNLSGRSIWVSIISLIFLASLLLQAAGPRRILNPAEENLTANILFLIDVSRSMAAAMDCDTSTRLDRAREIMANILSDLPAAKFAFSGFSSLTFALSEMSYDRQYLMDVLENGIFIEVIPIPGSDLANALHVILEKKHGQPPVYADVDYVVLFSDGDFTTQDVEALDLVIPLVQESKLEIISVGMGSDEAVPIPTLDENRQCIEGQYERAEGKEFYTNLVEGPLNSIAEVTGGAYFHEDQENELLSFLNTKLKPLAGIQPPEQTEEFGQVLLLISTLSFLILVLIRRL